MPLAECDRRVRGHGAAASGHLRQGSASGWARPERSRPPPTRVVAQRVSVGLVAVGLRLARLAGLAVRLCRGILRPVATPSPWRPCSPCSPRAAPGVPVVATAAPSCAMYCTHSPWLRNGWAASSSGASAAQPPFLHAATAELFPGSSVRRRMPPPASPAGSPPPARRPTARRPCARRSVPTPCVQGYTPETAAAQRRAAAQASVAASNATGPEPEGSGPVERLDRSG